MANEPIEKIYEDVQLHIAFSQAASRSNIVTYDSTAQEPENISTAFGKLSKWYEALVPTGGSSGKILAWNSSGTAKWSDPLHPTITKSADTTSTASPAHGGTFTTVDSVTRDANGHVTKINTKTVTLPSDQNTDTLMTQTNTTGSADYRVLLSGNANDTTETTTGRKSTNLKFNPSTGVLSASSGVTTKTITRSALKGMLTGSGTAAQDKGSGVSPRYFPAKWTFNTGLTAANGDVFIIKLPTAGHSYGVFLSIDNGANYYPISVTGTTRLTTHYGNGYSIAVMFKSDGSTADVFPFAGGDSRSTVTGGCWQVLNYYDSGNTNTKVNVTLGTTTKAYLLGTSTTPTSSAQAVTSIADTGVYLGTTAGSLYATKFVGALQGNADTATTATKATQDGDGNTISSTYLKLSGGTMTGTLTAKASQYGDEYGGALNMNNSNIYGVNAIYTADVSDNAAEGIHFYRDSTHVDTLWMNGGSLLFVPNRELGTSTTAANSQKVARFTANPTTGQVVVTDGTTGGIKSSGYTIATSVPSGAVFTDQKVRQSATTTEDFRPILMGATHVSGSSTGLDATVTDEAYVSTKLYCQPKTGNLYVAGDIKRANNTLSLWSGNDYAGVSQRNNYDINTWYGFSVSNACTTTGTLNKVAFSVNARNGQAWHTGNVHLYSASGDSPALVFQRGTFVDDLNDWKIYVSGGELRFAQSTANASSETWTTKMYFHSSNGNLYVGSTKVSLEGHTHSNYLGTKSDGSYYGMASPAGADNVWIRTTSLGIIPYQSGSAGSGHSSLGTSTWYFSSAYIDTVHGSLDGTASQAVKLRSSAARTDSTVDTADTTPYQKYWVKIASCYTTGNYTDLESLWAVNDVYGNRQGILKVRARVDGTAGTFGNTRTIRWIVADSDIDVNRFAIVCYNNRKPDGTTASGTATVELWWKSTGQYASFSFVLLDETRRTGKQPNDWVLYDTSTYGQAALPTTGNITYSVAATILNSTTGNAATATTAANTNVTVTDVPSTSTATSDSWYRSYGLLFAQNPNTTQANTLRKSHNLRFYHSPNGTSDTVGVGELIVGNNTASGTAGNMRGQLCLYSSSSSYITMVPTATSSPVILTLPAVTGTVPSFTATPTSGQVVITNGTGGGIKSSGYTIEKSVPSNAVFTDHITTVTSSGSGNAVTAISADANGALTVTKGSTFSLSTHTHGLLHSDLNQAATNGTTGGWSVIGIDPAVNGYVLKSIRINTTSPDWLSGGYGAGIAFGGADTKGVISMRWDSPVITFAGGNHKSTITSPTWYFKISGTSGSTYDLANFYDTTTSRTANTVLAAPNGSNGGATFRKLVAADLPSHTHNYAGSSSAGGPALSVSTAGGDVVLGTPSSSSNDSGDIYWKYGNGQEKARLYLSDTYTAKEGPLYRIFKSDGTGLYSGRLPLADGTSASGTWGISITGSAASAAKLETARNIALAEDFAGSADFDGSGNISISGTFYRCSASSNNTANYPWHRIAYRTGVTGNYNDTDAIFMIRAYYNGGPFGIIKVTMRTNGSGANCQVAARWLVRQNIAANDVYIAQWGKTGQSVYADIFLKGTTYNRTYVYQIAGSRLWTLVNSGEASDTTTSDKKTSTEVYASIAAAGTALHNQAYTQTVAGIDEGHVNSANSATYATRADYVNVVASNEIRFYNDNQFTANKHFWLGYSWAAGSHYTPSGGSDTSSTTAPNITEFVMGNCTAGGLASVHAKTFILGNGSSPTKSSNTTTIATAATTTDRTITLPDDSGTVALTSKTFNVTRGSSVSTATAGYWAAMCKSGQTGSTAVLPTSGKWWHVISMDWTNNDVKNWISQLAIATQDGSGVWWRRNDTGGTTIDSYSWHRLAEGNSSGAATNIATEVGNSAGERPVFYAYLGDNTRVVYNTSFTYNPGLSGGVLYAPYTASKLRTLLIARQSSLNLTTSGVPSMQLLLSTSSCSTGKPAQDGYVMSFDWDGTGNWQSQLFIPCEYNAPPQYRCQSGSATWQNSAWIDIGTHRVMYVNDNNTSATIDNVAVPAHTQTVKIVFKSSSGVYSMVEVPYLGSGKFATGLVQVGSLSDGSGSARIIMKSFILTYGTGSSSGVKFSFSFSQSEQVNGTTVSQTSQNLYAVKLIACT